jgi:hypothetical protein
LHAAHEEPTERAKEEADLGAYSRPAAEGQSRLGCRRDGRRIVMERRGRNLVLALVVAVMAGGSALEAGQAQRRERAPGPVRSLWEWVVNELRAVAHPLALKLCEHGSSSDPDGCPFAAATAEDPPGERGPETDPNG